MQGLRRTGLPCAESCRGESEDEILERHRPAETRPAWQDNAGYDKLVQYWLANKYTLRYTGGMVPDVNQLLVKGEGVFTNASSPSAPAKASRPRLPSELLMRRH